MAGEPGWGVCHVLRYKQGWCGGAARVSGLACGGRGSFSRGMKVRIEVRRYRLPFRAAVRTAHGVWPEREGVVVRLADERGHVGFGEAAPIPWFGTEAAEEAEAALRALGEHVEEARLDELPVRLPCARNALASARAELRRRELAHDAGAARDEASDYRAVAALLPAGRAALEVARVKAEAGFRTFKWKVGVGDVRDELALLDDLWAELPDGARLRLDANGAWDRRRAEQWLERCAERPVEFVEQPCLAEPGATEARRKRVEDTLRGLAEDFPTPLALDESVVGDGDVERWLAAGWRGIFVIKPALLGDAAGTLARLAAAKAEVVFSSALETAVGARTALRLAFAWAGTRRALGFGVWPLFVDTRCDGPHAAPFLRASDVERIDPEAVWNALT